MPTPTRPTLTVITPSLNTGRYLERTLCSVLDQAYPGLEFIVVDGGSTDESVELIQAYEDDLAAWRSGPDAGVAAAINWGLERASGEWVMIVPAGDVLMPGALDRVAEGITRHPDASWLTGHALRLDEQDMTLGVVAASAEPTLMRWLMHDTAPAAVAANVYHRELFAAHGHFDAGLRFEWSYEFTARLLDAGRQPVLLSVDLAGERHETYHLPEIAPTLSRGYEQIAAAERFADRLSPEQRPVLWKNLDFRRQIHAIAEAEAAGPEGHKVLWRRLMDRPWWINSDRYRRAIAAAANQQMDLEDMPAPMRRAA